MTAAKSEPPGKAAKKLNSAASPSCADDLGVDISHLLPCFPHEQETPYVLVRVTDAHAKAWASALGVTVRRCYVTDALLEARAKELAVSKSDIVSAKLPDAGSTMAGDFGEILVYLYQAAKEHPQIAFGPKKWRLKQDRTKPAPYSDVVQFILPTWPTASDRDVLLCSEVKLKSTDGDSRPIHAAIEDSAKDRTSRLARTLAWLKERALLEDLGDVTIPHIDRFLNAIDNPPAAKRFRAVAVVCTSLVDAELADAPTTVPSEYTVVVIAVPALKATYTSVFNAVKSSVIAPVPAPKAGKFR